MSEVIRYPKRLIEVDLPIKRISLHARREKSIRQGHISTLHIWWARRPLAACRAVVLAALWPDPADSNCPNAFRNEAAERMKALRDRRGGPQRNWDDRLELRNALLDFIADFANWDLMNETDYLETSRALTRAAHESLGGPVGSRPLVVDPFAGGGAIPLEAARVGADVFASDLNPIPVILNTVLLEHLPKYGQSLLEQLTVAAHQIKEQAKQELGKFYPGEPNGGSPVAYIWARTVLSEAPEVGDVPVEIPLLRSMWLVNKSGRYRALRWLRDKNGVVRTQVVAIRYADGTNRKVRRPLLEVIEPAKTKDVGPGTSAGGAATCPVTGFTTPVESVRRQMKARRGGAHDARLVAVVTTRTGEVGRSYRVPNESDNAAAEAAAEDLKQRIERHKGEMPLLPDGEINHLRGFFNVVLYGMEKWGDLFAPRQALALVTLSRLTREVGERLRKDCSDGLALAVQTCLALAVDRCANQFSSLSKWHCGREQVDGVFARQALPMLWDWGEINLFGGVGGYWDGAVHWILQVLRSSELPNEGRVEQASATAHPLPNDAAQAVFTDPPYYAAVPYADLSDFFYSWLRRSLANRQLEILQSPLTPKREECVSLSHRAAMYREKDNAWFEAMMAKACREARRITEPRGMGVFVFASKETPAWEAMLAALVSSGWVVTASWPIDTEMGSRLRARNSATLGSSVHIVCRPRENEDGTVREDAIGDWRDVLAALPRRIHDWLPRLALEGVIGADAIFACLGPALEIFSQYSRVEKASGEPVPLKEYLEHVWAAVAKEALTMIFAGADASGFEEDARLTAMWLWTLSTGAPPADGRVDAEEDEADAEGDGSEGGKSKMTGFALEYDAARKIAQGLGAHLEQTSLIEVRGSTARLLPVAERTRSLFPKGDTPNPVRRGKGAKVKKKDGQLPMGFLAEIEESEETGGWGHAGIPQRGKTVLDRVHQAMILFGAGRGEALRRFLVDAGVGRDDRFWRLAQALSALYPAATDEKRWVDGVLARKKGLGA